MGDVLNRGTKAQPRWYCRYIDSDGKRKQRATRQPTRAGAERVLAEIEARIRRGEIGIHEPTPEERARRTITIDTLCELFLAEYFPPHVKSLKNYRRDARTVINARILPQLHGRAAASISLADVERMRNTMTVDEMAASSIRQTLAILSKAYNWARRAGVIDCANPVAGCERPRTVAATEFLSRDDVTRFLDTVEPLAASAVASWATRTAFVMAATAIYTGMRKGELFGLHWRDVVFDSKRIDVNRSYELLPKSGDVRHVPLHPELAQILGEWKKICPRTDQDLVFPVEAEPDRLRMGVKLDMLGLRELLALSGCRAPAMPWHALRHTFAAHAVMSGASLYGVQRLLGHSTPIMTQRYAHLAPEFLAHEVARLGFRATKRDLLDLDDERIRRQAVAR